MSKWNVTHGMDGPFVTQANGEIVCGPFDCCEKYAEERARLISKAPEMLELLKALVKTTITWDIHSKSIDEAITLITEIEGEPDV